MDYERKYKQALERARQFIEHPLQEDSENIVEYIFPELKESKDDVIRKAIIAYIDHGQHNGISNKDMIAWLERQGDVNEISAEWSEKDEQMILSIEQIMNCASLLNIVPEKIDNIKSWLKSLRPQKQWKPSTAHKREVDAAYLQGICDAKQEIEKRSEQAITDKVEPKVRDWVILNSTVAQILDKQKYGFVGLDTDGKDFFCNYGHTDSIRLWSIADAKEGDILATDESVFIYAKVIYNKPYAYCGVDKFGVFKDNCLENNWSNSLDNIYPASKEQRDLLFQKIKEAGYKWDAVKKELKKVEVTSKEDEDEKIRKSIIAILDNYIDDDNTIKPVIMNWLEKQGKALNPDKVIEWLKTHGNLWPCVTIEINKVINKFKEDFEL